MDLLRQVYWYRGRTLEINPPVSHKIGHPINERDDDGFLFKCVAPSSVKIDQDESTFHLTFTGRQIEKRVQIYFRVHRTQVCPSDAKTRTHIHTHTHSHSKS